VLRGKLTAVNTYIIKEERLHINNLTVYVKILQKSENKPKASRIKEIVKIRAEVIGIGKKKQQQNQ
jgi:hypothetical protein